MMAKLDADHERMMASLGNMEATDLEANPERTMGRSLRKMLQWKLKERQISGIGAGI
jgi:hypothetical protein